MYRRRHLHKKLSRVLLEYSVHLWVLLFLVTLAVLYTVHSFLMASTCMTRPQIVSDNRCLYIWGNQVFAVGTRSAPDRGRACGSEVTTLVPPSYSSDPSSYLLSHFVANVCKGNSSDAITAVTSPQKNAVSSSPSLALSQPPSVPPSDTPTPLPTSTPAPTPTPAGPVIDVVFGIPGIGSAGANFKPLHPVRNLFIYLYASDANSFDSTVSPIYTVKTKANYDADPNSPTYSSFVNHYVDVGPVKEAEYQVVLQSDQTLRQLVKSSDKTKTVGGQLFTFAPNQSFPIPRQIMMTGDVVPYPAGDNLINISDYNALVDCYGNKATTSSCVNKSAADLDDNGVVDGVDYNILLASFKQLIALGYPAPKLILSPTPRPHRVIPTTAPIRKAVETPASASAAKSVKKSGGGAGGVILFILFLLLLGGAAFFAYKKGLLDKFIHKAPPPPPADAQQPADTDQSEVPQESAGEETSAPVEAEVPVEQDATGDAAPTEGLIDNTYFVKNKSKDDKGVWVVLTDDNGPVDGYFMGGEISDGFSRIKGTLKQDGGKSYVEITEVLPAE